MNINIFYSIKFTLYLIRRISDDTVDMVNSSTDIEG